MHSPQRDSFSIWGVAWMWARNEAGNMMCRHGCSLNLLASGLGQCVACVYMWWYSQEPTYSGPYPCQ
jgi:hypothetical protein